MVGSSYPRRNEWIGWFPATMSSLEATVAWTPTIVAIFTAWAAGIPRTFRFDEWASSSPRLAGGRASPAAVFGVLVTAAGTLAGVLALLALSVQGGLGLADIRGATVLAVPTVLAYTVTWALLGAWMGSRLPRSVALPLSGIAPYAVFAALALYPDSAFAGMAVGEGRVYAYVQPTDGTFVLRLVFWAAAAACMWGYLTQRARLASALSLVVSLSLGAVIFQGMAIKPIASATDVRCVEGRPALCVDESFASVLPQYRQAVDDVWPSIPEPLRPAAIGMQENVLRGRTDSIVAPPVSGFAGPSRIIDRTMFAARLGDALFFSGCSAGQRADGMVPLGLWWRGVHNVAVDGSAYVGDLNYPAMDPNFTRNNERAAGLAAMSPSELRSWFERNAPNIRRCAGDEIWRQ